MRRNYAAFERAVKLWWREGWAQVSEPLGVCWVESGRGGWVPQPTAGIDGRPGSLIGGPADSSAPRQTLTARTYADAIRYEPSPRSTSGRRCATKRSCSSGVSCSSIASCRVGASGFGAKLRVIQFLQP